MTSPGGGDRNANVVLTADTSQYQQQMQQSTQQTNHLSAALTTLTGHLDGITKRAGKRLFQFSAGDFAALAGATATAATFEKQLATLKATADVTHQSFGNLKNGIEKTFTSLPVSRTQVIQLTEAITNLGVTSTKDIASLAATFTKLGAATGESTTELAQGLTQLSRLMGTTNSQQIGNYANSLLTVSKNAGVSASGVLSFSQAIAPLARQAGIGEASVLGISTAFSKAGADGYVAANTFNSLVSDITNLVQTGSPDLEKYAKLIGVTAGRFKEMDKTTAITKIFESINSQGPKAIQTLNQLGIDGVRAQSAISAVVQSGNLQQSIAQATGSSNDQGNLNRASKDAMSGVADELIRVRNNFTQLGTEIGTSFLTPLEKVLAVFNQMFVTFNKIIKPFTPLIAAVGALASALTGLGAAALLTFGIVSKLATLRLLATGSPIGAFMGGMRAGRNPEAPNAVAERAAAGSLRFYQRPFFYAGSGVGRVMGEGTGAPSLVQQGATAAMRAPFVVSRYLANSSSALMADSMRPPFERGSQAPANMSIIGRVRARAAGAYLAAEEPYRPMPGPGNYRPMPGPGRPTPEGGGFAAYAKAQEAQTAATRASTAAVVANSVGQREQMTIGRAFAIEMRATTLSMAKLGATTLATGARMAGGAAAMVGGAAARGVGSLLTSPLGLIGASLFLPSIIGAFHHKGDDHTSVTGDTDISKYDSKLGETSTNLATFSSAVSSATDRLNNLAGASFSNVSKITPSDVSAATNGYKVVDQTLGSFRGSRGVGAGAAYIQGLAAQHGGLDAKYFQQIKTDLISTVGKDQAQRIINAYSNTSGAGSGTPSVNYGALGQLGSSLRAKDFQSLTNASFGSIKAQAQLQPGKQSSIAELNSVLALSGALVGVRGGANGPSQRTPQAGNFAKNLQQLYGISYPTNALLNQNDIKDASTAQAATIYQLLGTGAGKGNKPIREQRALLSSLGVNSTDFYKNINSYIKTSGVNSGGLDQKANNQLGAYILSLLPKGNKFDTQLSLGGTERSALGSSQLGKFILGNSAVQSTIGVGPNIADPKKQIQSQDALYNQAMKLTGGFGNAAAALAKLADTATNQADPALAALAQAASQQARNNYEATVVPTLSRSQLTRYRGQQLNTAKQQMDSTGTEASKQNYQQALGAYQQQEEANRQYLVNLYTTLRSYNTQMQRSYADYYKSVRRNQRDFNIQMEHGQRDFNIQAARSQRDFNIQLRQQAEQTAQTIYNPYQRVFDQQTADVGTVLQNLDDQNQRIQQQYQNLKTLRKDGVSQQTIDTLNLADPSNAQQLQNMVEGITNNPNMVRAINAAVKQRAKSTTALTQSDFNLTFRETVDAYHRQFNDMTQDFRRSRDDAEAAEKRGLDDMATDFNTMIQRSAQDLNTGLQEITGSFTDLLPKVFKQLGQQVAQYAPQYAKAIQDAIDGITPPGGPSGGSGGGGNGNSKPIALGSGGNPITTPGTLGINPQGQLGSYTKGGKFIPYTGSRNPGVLDGAQNKHIDSPTAAPNHQSAQTPAGAKRYAQHRLAAYGWGQDQMAPLIKLWDNESGWNYAAYNAGSGATGIPQSLPGSKMASAGPDWKTNGATQIEWGLGYIKGRYGSPAAASRFEFSHDPHWYDHGGVLKPGVTNTINMTGKNEFILTAEQMKAVQTNGLGTPVQNVYKVYNDMSNTFRDITVVAADPMAMARELKQKARLSRLVTPPRATVS